MRLKSFFAFALLVYTMSASAQLPGSSIDSTINNLTLPGGYMTADYGALPSYTKTGHGRQTIILIPGLGFDASVFDDFMEANKNNYTMYAITIPGYGKTSAPPMPSGETSYGDQTWNRGVLMGILKLIEKEKLQKPVIAGHFTQGAQLALRMAIDHPTKTGGVIIMGGQAKFIATTPRGPKDFSVDTMILFTDKYTSQQWFKHMKKKYFDDNNYLPSIYSLDSARGAAYWQQAASVPMPVMVRYLCEFFASDIKTELDKIKCPVLVVRAMYNRQVLETPVNNYVKPQFIDTWSDVPQRNPLIKILDVQDAGGFVWKDKPGETYTAIRQFMDKQL